MNYCDIIERISYDILEKNDPGNVASYIPELAKINPDKYGVFIKPIDQEGCGVGSCHEKFSIQSISKVLLLAKSYGIHGELLWKRMGYEPSGDSFNSLVQLEYEKGIPRNPLINAGALVLCDILIDSLPKPKDDFLGFVRKLAVDDTISYNEKIAESEAKNGYTNSAIAYLIKSFGNLKNPVEEVLDFYFHVCAIEMSVETLATSFLFLANGGIVPKTKERILSLSKTKRINAIMQTCGFYDEAGEFAFKVGLPGKSGVGGGIVAVHPGIYSVAVWSPKLNKKGNSYKGMKLLEQLTSATDSSIF